MYRNSKPCKSNYSGTPPYDHPVYKTTSLLRPYSFKPKVQNIDSFYYFEDPVNATTSLLRPGFYGPTVVVLTGFHCNYKSCLLNLSHDQLKMRTGRLNQVVTWREHSTSSSYWMKHNCRTVVTFTVKLRCRNPLGHPSR